MKRIRKIIGCVLSAVVLLCAAANSPVLTAEAMTIYESDGCSHAEGYIFIGESHCQVASMAMRELANEDGIIPGIPDISYNFREDWSLSTGDEGEPNTIFMKGNLFFVYESIWTEVESGIQTDKTYIYSDGKGESGRGVKRIHEIIEGNPNISHWNIIAYQGAVAVSKNGPEIGKYYADSYQNWISYEFPEADIYFLSMSTMTKCYRGVKHKDAINDALAKAFPDQYLDYTDFYNARYPGEMLSPADQIHWNYRTYQELITDVIRKIQQNRGIEEHVVKVVVTDVEAVLYTNDNTVILVKPDWNAQILFPEVDARLPVHVTGITDNGFFRVELGERTVYIHGVGLSEN